MTPRDYDERLLKMVKMRCGGMTTVAISRQTGVEQANVSQTTLKVARDDLKFSGEPEGLVRAAYWPGV